MLNNPAKKSNNETFGMSCEKAICEVNSDVNPKSKISDDRCNKEIVEKLKTPFSVFQKTNKISPLIYTGENGNKTDFVDTDGKTYSIKSNIKGNNKVCPQGIGQPTKKVFMDLVYNHINKNKVTDLPNADLKKNIFEHIDKYLNLYLQNLFCCDYLIHITDSMSFKLIDKMKFIFDKEKVTFTNTCEKWKEGITVKYNNVSIGEFQFHRNRDCIKFRFLLKNLLSIITK